MTEGREEKHTPGPWTVKAGKEPLRPTTYEIRNFDNLLIATVNIGMGDVEENAKLIASAPTLRDQLSKEREMKKELVSGLRKAKKYVSEGSDMFESATDGQDIKREFQDAVNEITILIAKATELDKK